MSTGYYPTIMGMAKDMRQGRAWIKVQLSASEQSMHASEIVGYWRTLKEAARHVERAIRMYYALQAGDASLLKEYFPLLTLARPAAPELPMMEFEPGEVRAAQRSDVQDVEDFMASLGLD